MKNTDNAGLSVSFSCIGTLASWEAWLRNDICAIKQITWCVYHIKFFFFLLNKVHCHRSRFSVTNHFIHLCLWNIPFFVYIYVWYRNLINISKNTAAVVCRKHQTALTSRAIYSTMYSLSFIDDGWPKWTSPICNVLQLSICDINCVCN